jgi:hypothetical protein
MKRVMDVVEVIGLDNLTLKTELDRLKSYVNAISGGGFGLPNGIGELKDINITSKQDSLSRNKYTDNINITNADNSITTITYIRDFDGVIRDVQTTNSIN